MKKYEFLDHTADLKIRAFGKNLEEAFVNCAIGGFNFLTDTSKIKKKNKHKINITSNHLESLISFILVRSILSFIIIKKSKVN